MKMKFWGDHVMVDGENETLIKEIFKTVYCKTCFIFCFSKQMDITAILYLLPSYNSVNSNDI